MKNYELIMELSELPAGADVNFECMCDSSEVDIQNDSDDGDIYVVTKKISEVYIESDRICLS